MKVNKTRCATCPFNPDGVQEVRQSVLSRIGEASQLCHHTNNKTLCRGARDVQLAYFATCGIIKQATDEAWDQACKEMGITPNAITKRVNLHGG